MPNLLAHNLLVNKLYNESILNDDSKKNFLVGNLDYLKCGAQGPDPLFFTGITFRNGFYPFSAMKNFGSKIHHTNGERFLSILVNEYFDLVDEKELDKCESFIVGQFSHYLLDSIAHPYIYYMSGFNNKGKVTSHYHYDHCHFESEIDVALSNRYNIINFTNSPNLQLCKNKHVLFDIDRWMRHVLYTMFDLKKLPEHLYTSGLLNMSHFWKVMNNNLGGLRSFFIPKFISIKGMHFPKSIDDDVLNLNHNKWYNPETGEESSKSFLDLFDEAYSKLLTVFNSITSNTLTISAIQMYLNTDYSGVTPSGVKKYNYKNKP